MLICYDFKVKSKLNLNCYLERSLCMITGRVQINKGYYFVVFNMYNEYEKRKPEWHSTGLKVDNNERKNNQIRKQAEKILNQELVRINAENSFSNKMNTIYKDFICLMDNGKLVKPDYVARTFSRILKENGFRHIRLHDLRHSCATLLLRNGVPLPEIQKWLGHSNIITTQRYSHLDQNDKSIPANMIETKFNMSFISNDNKKEQMSIVT